MRKKQKQNKKSSQLPVLVCFLLIGAVCGWVMSSYVFSASAMPFDNPWLSFAVLFALMYLLIFAHIALHELGHLVCGLVTGYRFSSYRIGSLMILRDGSRLRLRFLSVAGTGGQCLMIPPEGDGTDCPVMLYNLGGGLFNIVFALLPGVLCLFGADSFLLTVLIMNGFIGTAFGLINCIPFKTGPVDNDGTNAFSLKKDPAARRAFVLQLRMNECISRGVRLKDMPEEWFAPASDENKDSVLACSMRVFACNRLLDAGNIVRTEEAILSVLHGGYALIDLHRSLLICDLIFCRILQKGEYAQLLTKDLLRFMRSMKNFPSVLRTEYALALARDGDAQKAVRIRAAFEKRAKKYPYPSEIQSERELMDMLDAQRT